MKAFARKCFVPGTAALLFAGGSLLFPMNFSGSATAAPLVIGTDGVTSYTTASLNSALSGYDSLTKDGDSTVSVTLSSVSLNTHSILVQDGVLRFTSSNPSASTHSEHVFTGTLHINSGAEVFLDAKDALGYTGNDSAERLTIENAGTLRLRSSTNQTMRPVTLDLQGGTVTGGEYQYRSDSSEIKATSGNSVFSSTLRFREAALAPEITASEGAVLTINGAVLVNDSSQTTSLSFNGGGKVILKPSSFDAIPAFNVDGAVLEIQSSTSTNNTGAIGRKVSTYNVSNGGMLILNGWDVLHSTGDAVTFHLNDGTLRTTGKEQTARNMTFNLTGAAIDGDTAIFLMSSSQYTTAVNVLASDKTSVISAGLQLRDQNAKDGSYTISVEDGAAAVDLELGSTITNYTDGRSDSLFLSGAGTVKFTGNWAAKGSLNLNGTTLLLGKENPFSTSLNLVTSGADAVGTFDLNGFDAEVGGLSGTGAVLNSGTENALLTVNASSASTFSGTVGEKVDLVKTGSGTWTILRDETMFGSDSLTVQNGTLDVKLASGVVTAGRILNGSITIEKSGTLLLSSSDALGAAGNGSWETAGLDLNIYGKLRVTAPKNQTQRYTNVHLYGGSMEMQSGQFLFVHNGTTPITTLTSHALNEDGTAVTQTSTISGALAVRDSGRELILNVEDAQPATDLWWTGTMKYSNDGADGHGTLVKTGAGTLRLSSSSSFPKFAHTDGTVVREGTLILDSANLTGSNVTVNEGTTFAAVDASQISKNLYLNGTLLLPLDEFAVSTSSTQLTLTELNFGETADIRALWSDETNWNSLDGLEFLTFSTASARDSAFEELTNLWKNADSGLVPIELFLSASGTSGIAFNVDRSAVPEPSACLLLFLGTAVLGAVSFRKGRKANQA